MEIQNIKQISITDYLQQQGYSPARVQGIHFWYCSPLRNESTPSFKVNTERNQWYDFGTGEHGDIIDLVRTLQHCTMYEAIELLIGSKQIVHQDFSFGGERKTSKHKLEIISVQSLTILICYVTSQNEEYLSASPIDSVLKFDTIIPIGHTMPLDLLTMLADGKFVVLILKVALLQKRLQLLVKAQTFYKSLKGL